MNALKLAFALLRIPRLFAYLFLLPLILSVALVYVQLVFTKALISVDNSDAKAIERHIKQTEQSNIVREFLYGSGAPLPPIKVCRWSMRELEDGSLKELPADESCRPDRLDVALLVEDPKSFDSSKYEKIFNGNVERLHICRSCRPDAVIEITPQGSESHAYSVMGLSVLNLVRFNPEVRQQYVQAAKGFDQIKGLLGTMHLHAQGFRDAINISGMNTSLALLFNLTFLILVTLWLALKAHRKVLDYFARSGALLPMVAATGKGSFYGAIWLLTIARVATFLFAAIPITMAGLSDFLSAQEINSFLGENYFEFAIWLLAIVASLSFATIVASVAELKHRHSLLSFMYRYLPFLISIVGAAIWGCTFLLDRFPHAVVVIRNVIASLPVIGIVPILVGPVFEPPLTVLVLHTLLTLILLSAVLKYNARWFAAHLEEL